MCFFYSIREFRPFDKRSMRRWNCEQHKAFNLSCTNRLWKIKRLFRNFSFTRSLLRVQSEKIFSILLCMRQGLTTFYSFKYCFKIFSTIFFVLLTVCAARYKILENQSIAHSTSIIAAAKNEKNNNGVAIFVPIAIIEWLFEFYFLLPRIFSRTIQKTPIKRFLCAFHDKYFFVLFIKKFSFKLFSCILKLHIFPVNSTAIFFKLTSLHPHLAISSKGMFTHVSLMK